MRSTVLSLCALLVCARVAAARPPAAEFQKHYEAALASYQKSEYAAAIVELQAAYAIKQLPRLLFNLAQAHRKLGHGQDAYDHYLLYQRTEPNLSAAERADLNGLLAQTRAMIDAARAVEESARAKPAEVAPEPPRLAWKPFDPPPAPKPAARWTRGSWAGVGVAGALAVSGIVTGALALADSAALKDERYAGAPTPQAQTLQASTRALAITTDVLLGGAAVALATTLVWTYTHKRTPSLHAAVGSHGFALQGAF